jgi:hypothetical protein
MTREPARLYTAIAGIFLLGQGTSTLMFRWIPSLDRAFPQLLATTRMVVPHSSLHILTGILALVVLARGRGGPFWFTVGFGLFYAGLACLGMMTAHPAMLGLQAFDHPFHLFLGALGLLAAALNLTHSRIV